MSSARISGSQSYLASVARAGFQAFFNIFNALTGLDGAGTGYSPQNAGTGNRYLVCVFFADHGATPEQNECADYSIYKAFRPAGFQPALFMNPKKYSCSSVE